MRKIIAGCFMALLLVGFMIGCRPAVVDTSAPTVSSTAPVNGATDVALNASITATFDEAMASATITADTFVVTSPGPTVVTGTVALDTAGTTATFTPTSALVGSTTYTATITTGATDATGNAVGSDVVWRFTTIETIPPTVSLVAPSNGAASVAINANVTASFSEAMDSSTIGATTFTVKGPGTTPVAGAVTYVGTTAIFNPDSNLAVSTLFTATITTGVKDVAGNALASAFVWTFTTGTTAAAGPAPVVLGTSGNFAILAKSGISSVPASAVTGDIGVSPAAATYITGFSLVADATNVFSTSTQVVGGGKVYAADYAVPTPSNLTTAVSNMQTAYTDAAGRAAGTTELGAGNIGGLTLVPGVYKWGTGVLIPTDVTLDGGANDVWIFQIAQGLTIASATDVLLINGADPKNIFWQVAETVSIGANAHFEGVILAQTDITLETGASINGRLLAQTAVTLDQSTVTQPAP